MPLNLLARHGVSREDIENRSESSGAGALFNDLFEANGIGQSGAIPASESKIPIIPAGPVRSPRKRAASTITATGMVAINRDVLAAEVYCNPMVSKIK